MKKAILALILLSGCASYRGAENEPRLNSITIVDNNGFTETITSKDRLEQYTRVDFKKPQSYQKVLRVYSRDSIGNVYAELTSYHQNGQLRQYLEAKNNNAFGAYKEWHPSGQLKVEATVISGTADLSESAEQTWLFDGTSRVWEEDGSLEATIEYSKGVLDGPSLYYHPNGRLWKRIPYERGMVNGIHEIYLDNGDCLQFTEYANGVKNGRSIRYWGPNKIASEEQYSEGLLVNGSYFNRAGEKIASISNGEGFKALFSFNGVAELQQFKHGKQEGIVKLFDSSGTLVSYHHIKDGKKHGEEVEYQELKLGTDTVKPKISLNWFEGVIQGVVKTWYDNGVLESQRETSHNQKNGLSTAWYRDGSLMLIEEYEQDKLVRGKYFKIGNKTPVSMIRDGTGIATLFDAEGNFSRKINYHNGTPLE